MAKHTPRQPGRIDLAASLKLVLAGHHIDEKDLVAACAYFMHLWGTPRGMDPADWSEESIDETAVALLQAIEEMPIDPCPPDAAGPRLRRRILADVHRYHREQTGYGRRRHELKDVAQPVRDSAPAPELIAALWTGLRQLSAEDQTLFIDAHVNGCTERALSAGLKISHQAVHKRLCRIAKDLQKIITGVLKQK